MSSSTSANQGGGNSAERGESANGPLDYPHYTDQVCYHCKNPDHEPQDCPKEFPGSVGNKCFCRRCGHGDHDLKKDCPLNPLVKGKQVSLSLKALNKMTPKMREKFKRYLADEIPIHGSNPTAESAQSPAISPPKSPVRSPLSNPDSNGSPSKGRGGDGSSTISPAPFMKGKKVSEETQKAWDEAEKLMPRPKSATKNDEKGHDVLANFFKITLAEGTKLYKYSITLGDIFEKKVSPPSKTPVKDQKDFERKLSRETKRYLIRELLIQNKPPHDNWACDYDSTIISSEPLYPKSALTVGQATDTHHDRSPKKEGDKRPIVKSKVSFVGFVDIKGLLNHVKGNDHDYASADQLRALNIISWKTINDDSFKGGLVGKKFYPSSLRDEKVEQENLVDPKKPFMIRKGFYSSMRPGVDSLYLNVNTTTSAFYAPIKLSKWMSLFWNDKDVAYKLKHFKSFCKNLRVTFDLHERTAKKSRKFIVCGISDESVGDTKFPTDRGGSAGVKQYLEKKYRTPINSNAFCINVGSESKKVWYPADLLTIIDWQVVNKVLPGDYGSDMVKEGERMPGRHKDLIEHTALSLLGLESGNSFYKNFGIETTNSFTKVVSRKFNPPKVKMKGNQTADVKEGAWNLKYLTFQTGAASLNALSIVSFCGDLEGTKLQVLGKAFKSYGVAKGFPGLSAVTATEPAHGENYRNNCQVTLNQAYDDLKRKSVPEVILVVLAKHDIPLYAEVKRWGDCIQGVPTVCITKVKLDKMNAGIAANICLKFNAKLCGVSHTLDSLVPPGTIIVGADCTHPADNAPFRPSIAGIVATNDDSSFQYLASARLQTSKTEYIEDLRSMMKERIMAWYTKMKTRPAPHPAASKASDTWLPKKILFYRDGVSESQYGMVRFQELPQIRAACEDALAELKAGGPHSHSFPAKFKYNPDITLIVVTKRHHARFYDSRISPTMKTNLPAGTVVDSEVVTPNHVNFYLQAHDSPKGTAKSAHYVVLEDTCKYTMKQLQEMTNKISYTGARATKALSVCTPAQYADLLCDRLRCYMRPAYEGKYRKNPEADTDTTGSTKSPAASASGHGKDKGKAVAVQTEVRADAVTNPDSTPEEYANDSHIWFPRPEMLGGPNRKNPWAAALDNVMFYI